MSRPRKLVLMGEGALINRPHLDRHMTSQWDIHEWVPEDGDDKAHALLSDADAIVVAWAGMLKPGQFFPYTDSARQLQLVQLPFAGYDWFNPAMFPQGCVLANAIGHEQPMAEFAFAALLEWEIKLCKIEAGFRHERQWIKGMAGESVLDTHGEIYGKTLGLFGFGNISRAIAKRARGFEMNVIGVARSKRDKTPEHLDWLGTMADFDRLLAESDYLILACDLNDDTRGLINMEAFRKMKKNAVVMNLARGPVIDEKALYEALRDKVIGGAIIDTWYDYPMRPRPGGTPEMQPRPSIYPLHELENIIMSPHFSALTKGADERRWHSIARNLDLLAIGERPATAVMDGSRIITS